MNIKALAIALTIFIGSHVNAATPDAGKVDKHIELPVIGVSLPQPKGFFKAKEFEGLVHLPTMSTVQLSSLRVSFLKLRDEFTTAALKEKGMTFISKNPVVIDGRKGLLIKVSQRSRKVKFLKWLIITGDQKETVLVAAAFRLAEDQKISQILRSILLRMKFLDPKKKLESENVGFSIGSSDKLKRVKSPIRGVRAEIYQREGVTKSTVAVEPILVAGISMSQPSIDDFKEFSVQRLRQDPLVKIKSLKSKRAITIDGLHGYQLIATGIHTSSGERVILNQVTLRYDERYVVISGRVGYKHAKEFMPEFKSMISGFRLQ